MAYGIDMRTTGELVPHARSVEEMQPLWGCDCRFSRELPHPISAVRTCRRYMTRFDTSVLTGEYVTKDSSMEYLNQRELFRSDAAKQNRNRAAQTVIELKNA